MPRGPKKRLKPKVEPAENASKRPVPAQLTPWQPGQSGNPGGKPASYKVIRAYCQQHTMTAARKLVSLINCPDWRIAYAASVYVIERGAGKIREIDDDRERHRPDLAQLNPKELHTFRKLAAKMMTLPAEREPETIDAEGVEVQPNSAAPTAAG